MLHVQFIDGPNGALLCTERRPQGAPRGTLMVLPAFGDEMNKCRPMVAATAQRLAAAGYAVLVPDLYGTGDSAGAFADASWQGWQQDLEACAAWSASQGRAVDRLLAIRTGCLLVPTLLASLTPVAGALFWQPVAKGRTFLKQLLRMRAMASAVNAGKPERVEDLRQRILDGETLLVGGYALTAAVVAGLEAANLDELDGIGALQAIEIARDPERCGEAQARYGGCAATVYRQLGEPYWNAVETVVDLDVVERSVALLAA